jgi:histone H3/H4
VTQLLAIHGKHVTIMSKDMILVEALREMMTGETIYKPPK